MGKMILVTGGARRGKSAFAEQLARESGGSVAYIATAEVWDEEMAHRVTLHRSRRPAGWKTYEAPREAAAVIREAGREHGVILFDCVTIYLSNMLCRETEPYDEAHLTVLVLSGVVGGEMGALVEAAQGLPKEAEVLFVTNEVGAGIVPENRLARLYRYLAGLANQQLAAAADAVYAVLCGIPLRIK